MAEEGAVSRINEVIGGKYRLLRSLGGGGMGDVYEAENLAVGRRVALKLLHPELALNADMVGRFQQEARSATRIGHPNIVGIFDLDRDAASGALYMVQELLTGMDLRQRLDAEGRIDAAESLRIVAPILDALAAAHEQGVLHRDIKPANIFLAREPSGLITPKLIDFGVAKVMAEHDAKAVQTRVAIFVGTLSYMSPEQLRGLEDIDGRADIWAMGVMLYEMVSGRCPFIAPKVSDLPSVARYADRVNSETAPSIAEVFPEVPTDVAEVLRRALVTDRDHRFQTMREFYDAVLAAPTSQNAAAPVLAGAAAFGIPARVSLPSMAVQSGPSRNSMLPMPVQSGPSRISAPPVPARSGPSHISVPPTRAQSGPPPIPEEAGPSRISAPSIPAQSVPPVPPRISSPAMPVQPVQPESQRIFAPSIPVQPVPQRISSPSLPAHPRHSALTVPMQIISDQRPATPVQPAVVATAPGRAGNKSGSSLARAVVIAGVAAAAVGAAALLLPSVLGQTAGRPGGSEALPAQIAAPPVVAAPVQPPPPVPVVVPAPVPSPAVHADGGVSAQAAQEKAQAAKTRRAAANAAAKAAAHSDEPDVDNGAPILR